MRPCLPLLALLSLVSTLTAALPAWSQGAPAATEIVNWTFDEGDLKGWSCKSNATMSLAEEAGRGRVLQGTITYGEFGFGWFTRTSAETDFTGAWAVELDVRGDGQGGKLNLQLGRRGDKQSVYWANDADAVTLDFTGWRHVTFLLRNFTANSADRSRQDDLSKVFFLELMVQGGRKEGSTRIACDNIRAVAPTPAQAALLAQLAAEAAKLDATPALDGSNLLPNPGFEQDLDGDGAPDMWRGGDWGTGSVAAVEKDAHSGTRAVSVGCRTEQQRGSWSLRLRLTPGPWRFRAWYRTQGLRAAANKGPDARLTCSDGAGKTIRDFHAYGTDTGGKWQQTEVAFEAPVGTAFVYLDLFNSFGVGKVSWDDCTLVADVAALAARQRAAEENRKALAAAQERLPAARQAVAAVKTRAGQTDDWQLLVAVLDWALEDAGLAVQAQLGTSALATLQDVEDYCRRADELVAAAAKSRHPQKLAADADANPYYAALNKDAAGLASAVPGYKKGAEGYQQIPNAWTFSTLGAHTAVAAWGLLHPRSASYHNPLLLRRMLVYLQAITQNHADGDFNPRREAIYGSDPNINRFCLSPALDGLLQLQAEYPWTILPSKRQEWLEQLRVLVEFQYRTYGPREPLDPQRPRYYPNMDVHHLLIMEFAHRLFGDEKYAQDRDTMLQWLAGALYPQGAFTYIWPQNECYVYHQLNVTFIARYYELTKDRRAYEILRKTIPYYPQVHDPEGMTESYTDCSWKHYWSAATPAGADLIAGMFNDGGNKWAAQVAARRGYGGGTAALYTAPWWKDLPPARPPDNRLVYDPDIQGPRGQFGAFGFAATARRTPPGEIGKDTFVGCMIGDRNGKGLPLDAALQIATVETRLKPDGTHWQNARFCSGHEQPSVVVTPDFATLCVRYRLTRPAWGHGSGDEPWEGLQQWFLCRDRLVGLLTIRALQDTQCAGVWGRLRFGIGKELEQGQGGLLKYGSLIARVPDHNFAKLQTAPSETFYLDKPDNFRSRELLLKDAQAVSGEAGPFNYRAGDQFYFVAEVLPYTSDLATEVRRVTAGPLLGLQFRQGQESTLVLHNPTDRPAPYTGAASGTQVSVFSPGGESRLVPVTGGRYRCSVPANSQVVVRTR